MEKFEAQSTDFLSYTALQSSPIHLFLQVWSPPVSLFGHSNEYILQISKMHSTIHFDFGWEAVSFCCFFLYFLYILLHWGKVCYFVWRFFGTLKCEAERRPRSVGVALEFRFCEAQCTFYHLISRILVQWRMELLRSVHISDPVYRAYGGFSKIFRHFQGSQ